MNSYEENPDYLALKEWQVTIDALLCGELAFLLRKGGIHEPGNRSLPFRSVVLADAERFWLYPTYEHQFESEGDVLLKEPWASRLKASHRIYREGDESIGGMVHTPPTIHLQGYAETRNVYELWTEASVNILAEHGIWLPTWAEKRLRWKPREPLLVFHLQVYRLAEPLPVDSDAAPKRCRSWLEVPYALREYQGEPVSCPSSPKIQALLRHLTDSEEEQGASLMGRVAMTAQSAVRQPAGRAE